MRKQDRDNKKSLIGLIQTLTFTPEPHLTPHPFFASLGRCETGDDLTKNRRRRQQAEFMLPGAAALPAPEQFATSRGCAGIAHMTINLSAPALVRGYRLHLASK